MFMEEQGINSDYSCLFAIFSSINTTGVNKVIFECKGLRITSVWRVAFSTNYKNSFLVLYAFTNLTADKKFWVGYKHDFFLHTTCIEDTSSNALISKIDVDMRSLQEIFDAFVSVDFKIWIEGRGTFIVILIEVL